MPDVELRTAEDADRPGILELLGDASLRWGADGASAALFAWKHDESPFGRSPAWVATVSGRLAGFRTFSRWEFLRDGRPVRAVRAVDTATHPDFQGRGIFSRLTLHALEEMRADGVDFVFNTPNANSLPGYLKMGWQAVGRLPVVARPRSLLRLPRLALARTAADKWSLPSDAGLPAAEALADEDAVDQLLAGPPGAGVRTRRTPAFLRWRYGFPPLHYRAVTAGRSVADGIAVFRVRPRGRATEAAIVDVLVPGGDRRTEARLVRDAVRVSGADYGIRLGRPALDGSLPVPGSGPTLVWRAVNDTVRPALDEWRLVLGDVELF